MKNDTKDPTEAVSKSDEDANRIGEKQHSKDPKQEFKDFFDKRKKIKREGHWKGPWGYVQIASFGWYIFLIGCAIAGFSFAILTLFNYTPASGTYALGVILVAVGVIVVSLVPVDEIDLETELSRENYRCRRTVVVSGVGIISVLFMIVLLQVPPYFVQTVMILQGVLIMDDNNYHAVFLEYIGIPGYLRPPKEFTLKVTQYIILAPMCFGLSTLVLGIDPHFFLRHCLVEGSCSEEFIEEAIIPYYHIYQIALIGVGIGTTLLTPIAIYVYWHHMCKIQKADRRPEGIETTCLFDSIYILIIGMAIVSIGYGSASLSVTFRGGGFSFMTGFQIGSGIFQVLAIMLVLLVGKEECFSVLDRYMESDVKRLMKDGSLLSELVSSSETFLQGDNYWVYRKSMFSDVASRKEYHIKREFFFKATIAEVTERDEIRHSKSRASENGQTSSEASVQVSLKLEVDVKEDCSSWTAKYNEIEIEIDNQYSLDEAPLDVNDRSVDKWIDNNLDKEKCRDISIKSDQTVTFHMDLPVEDKKKAQLLEWAKANVRYYEVEKTLPEDIFSKSPREIASEDLASTYAKSKPRTIEEKADKIDYFVSHSWAENAEVKEEKKKVLEQFGQEFFQKHKRMPTVWLDKYCINQKDSGNDISVLPIYISCCTKILVLLTPSYMKRLWCIWELFTLFIFTKKELAVRRLEIRLVGAQDGQEDEQYESFVEQLEEFDFDNAHCFSPQEEMKLRKIMYDIGEKKLREIKKEIHSMLKGQRKNRNNNIMNWCKCSDVTTRGKGSTGDTLSITHSPAHEQANKRDTSIVDDIPPPTTDTGIEMGNMGDVC